DSNERHALSQIRAFNDGMVRYTEGMNSASEGRENGDASRPQLPTLRSQMSGFSFMYEVHGAAQNPEYTVTARPVRYGISGTRSFYCDGSGVIRFTDEDREPTAEDRPLR